MTLKRDALLLAFAAVCVVASVALLAFGWTGPAVLSSGGPLITLAGVAVGRVSGAPTPKAEPAPEAD